MGCSDSKKEKKKRDLEVDGRSLITVLFSVQIDGVKRECQQIKIGIFKFKIVVILFDFHAGVNKQVVNLHWIIRNQD